jgi:small GTP-binding protein
MGRATRGVFFMHFHKRKKNRSTTKMVKKMGRETRIVFVGLAGVGKSSLFERVCHNRFSTEHTSTLGASFGKLYVANGTLVGERDAPAVSHALHVWDTAGQERYAGLVPMYYNGAQIVIVVHDGTPESIEYAQRMIDSIRSSNKGSQHIHVWQNKIDVNGQSTHVFKGIDTPTQAVSAKSGENVQSAFMIPVLAHLASVSTPPTDNPPVELSSSSWFSCWFL